jgi:hypothetical protein
MLEDRQYSSNRMDIVYVFFWVVQYSMLKLCCRGTVHVHAIRYPRLQVPSAGQAHSRWILWTRCSLGSQRDFPPLDVRRALPHLLLILPPRFT